jgi:hypothetical protein
MTTFLKRRLPILAAILVLILGGAVAAMAAGTSGGSHHHHRAGAHSGRAGRLLQSAATYIGVPVETLTADLRAGRSLGQVAVEAGRTEAGLVKTLTATASSGVEERLSELVKRPGGLHASHGRAHGMRLAAAGYLGITPTQLRADLHAGRTLADIANSTPGHSSAGLVSALVAAREALISADHTGSKAGATISAARSARLRRRITTFVDRPHAGRVRHPAGG